MKSNIMLFVVLVMLSETAYTQNIIGRWLLVAESGTFIDTSNFFLDISENKLTHRTFDEVLFTENYYIEDKIFICDGTPRYKIGYLDSEKINLIFFEEENKNPLFNLNFVRVVSTITELTAKEISAQTYCLKTPAEEPIRLTFDFQLSEDNFFELGQYIVGNRLTIRELDKTFFVVVYLNEYHIKLIPIKSATKEKLVLYGMDADFPERTFEAAAVIN